MIYAKIKQDDFEAIKQELKEAKDSKWYRRVKIIELSGQGKNVSELSGLFDVCNATVRGYIKSYNDNGLDGLKPNYEAAGCPQKIPFTREEWEELLHRSPCGFEKLNTGSRNWTQELLVEYFQEYHDIKITQSGICQIIKRMGLKWNRGKLKVSSPDPLYTVKRDRIEELKKKALEGTLSSHDAEDADLSVPPLPAKLVFFDSTDLHLCPDVGYSYVNTGGQYAVQSPGKENPWYALFGSIVYPTGEGLYTIHERKRHQEVMSHLKILTEWDPDVFWIVVMDNASAHTTPKLDSFKEQNKEHLKSVYLPTYSPNLNLIERVWKFMRGQVTRNQFYSTMKDLAQAAVDWLDKLPFSQFCSVIGIEESSL